eukprot:COSAG02_NODE_331_length_24480_cov_22.114720_19_plen_55_part_00
MSFAVKPPEKRHFFRARGMNQAVGRGRQLSRYIEPIHTERELLSRRHEFTHVRY